MMNFFGDGDETAAIDEMRRRRLEGDDEVVRWFVGLEELEGEAETVTDDDRLRDPSKTNLTSFSATTTISDDGDRRRRRRRSSMTCDARGNRGRDDDDRRRRSTFLVLREKLKIAHETDRRRVDGPAMKTWCLDLDYLDSMNLMKT